MTSDSADIPKLADVARLAGVGNATVSRALNGGKNVSADKMDRIKAAIEELNYRPNRVARSLKGARSGMIGMLVPSISDMFFSRCAEVVEGVARGRGALLVVVASHEEDSILIAGLRQLLLHHIDGLVLAYSKPHTRELTKALREVRVPIVGIDGPLTDVELPSVLCANFDGARMATEHLLEHGYETIISVQVKPTLYTMRERLRGYRAALEDTGRMPIAEVIGDRQGAIAMLRRHVRGGPPVAIFAGNNLTARYICEAMHTLQLSIPEQVAILSFDDFDLADTLTPPMSVVQQPLDEIGRCAARILFQRMDGESSGVNEPEERPLLLQPQLVLRESCGCHGGGSLSPLRETSERATVDLPA